MTALRIFSYLPNPRIYKASIAARLCGVAIDIRGDKPAALADWLWDYDAVALDDKLRERHADSARSARKGFAGTLFKTDAFLAAHPYGTVPAAFGGDGSVGIFESNSIMRAVARLGEDHDLYGSDALAASRIDSFLDVALVFAQASQAYLLMLRGDTIDSGIHARTAEALDHWLGGIERALSAGQGYIVGARLSLADICFACELLLMENEHYARERLADAGLTPLLEQSLRERYPLSCEHYTALGETPAFSADFAAFRKRLPHRL